jgi:hypothetical protein
MLIYTKMLRALITLPAETKVRENRNTRALVEVSRPA